MTRKNSPVRPQKGLNLGGWLVLEKWMTPSVFAGMTADNEFELSQTEDGRERILRHRETFITESDIAWIAQTGIEVLRLPIGYWAVFDTAPYVSAREQLDWLMDAAERYGLKVLIDLHAAPGAQNASDHSGSGRPGQVNWYAWKNRRLTAKLLKQLARDYGHHPAFWGIELLNEPLVETEQQRRQMHRWARRTTWQLRRILPKKARIVISDCYDPYWWSGRVGAATLDVHHYQCFGDDDVAATSYGYHGELLDNQAAKYRSYAAQQPIIIGEWSAALPPNTSSAKNRAALCRAQLAVDAHVDAWFFWSYKTENSKEWDFRYGLKQGWFDGVL